MTKTTRAAMRKDEMATYGVALTPPEAGFQPFYREGVRDEMKELVRLRRNGSTITPEDADAEFVDMMDIVSTRLEALKTAPMPASLAVRYDQRRRAVEAARKAYQMVMGG